MEEVFEEKEKNHIIVVDSPMASGKTTWAINHINKMDEDQKVIFITPYLDECMRVILGCSKKNFIQPDSKKGQGRKRIHFLELIKEGRNIVSTHSLFSAIDDEIINIIRSEDYTLVLDECFGVIEEYDIYKDMPRYENRREALTKQDISILLDEKRIKIENNYQISWVRDGYLGLYEPLKDMIDRGLLFLVNDSLLLWSFPIEVFDKSIFKNIFILTFQFKYQIQAYYYDYFSLEYDMCHIETIDGEYELVKTINDDYEKEWIKTIKPLITIHDENKLNRIGSVYMGIRGVEIKTALSKNWYLKNPSRYKKLSDNAVNYLRYYSKKEKSDDIMWTCFKEFNKDISARRLPLKHFVSLNARATNDFGHKKSLAYLINRYINPFYYQFFKRRGITVKENGLALSEMIQWIWRSRIRNNQPINIYIPSERMRTLLNNYLDGKELVF